MHYRLWLTLHFTAQEAVNSSNSLPKDEICSITLGHIDPACFVTIDLNGSSYYF